MSASNVPKSAVNEPSGLVVFVPPSEGSPPTQLAASLRYTGVVVSAVAETAIVSNMITATKSAAILFLLVFFIVFKSP